MRTTTLGDTGLTVSRVVLGTWQFGGDWGEFPESEAIEVIRHALGAGINFFDTAQAYGYGVSERVLGKALRDELRRDRDSVVIGTKGGLRPGDPDSRGRDASPEWMRVCLEQSLDLLGVDRIDLYQVHWPDPGVPVGETAGFMKEAIDEGLIGHAGVSNFSTEQIEEFAKVCPVTTVQPPYHMFRRDIETGLLPHASSHGISAIVYSPLASGLLGGRLDASTTFPAEDWRSQSSAFRGEGFRRNLAVIERLREFAGQRDLSVAQLAIAWTLANPAVDAAIISARSTRNVTGSAAAGDVELDERDLKEIDQILADAVPVGGISPEGID